MGDLGRWNFLIGFGVLFLGSGLFAHPSHAARPWPRRRRRDARLLPDRPGVDRRLLHGRPGRDPARFRDLDAYNLLVGIGFMAVGFVFATRWE